MSPLADKIGEWGKDELSRFIDQQMQKSLEALG